MSGQKEKSLSTLYLELFRYEQNEEYERALKTCNRILNSVPNESKALHCKIVCMIQIGKFDEALQLVQKNKEQTREFYFEKAYCQYRLNQPEKALVTVNAAPELTHQLTELKAQILYRLEQYENCYTLYRDVFKNISDEYNDERLANLNAIGANLGDVQIPDSRICTYEIVFNIAYKCIENEKYVEAEKKLKMCEVLCREALEDDGCTDDEVDNELAIVKVQLAYCYQKQGRNREAQQLYTSFLKQKSDDVGLVAVASNNAVVINKDQNIFDSKKKIKYATQEVLDYKLNQFQRKHIALNHCLLCYYLSQLEQCRKLCDKMALRWPDMSINASVLKALVAMKEDSNEKAIELLEKLSKKLPNQKLYLQLTIVHLLLCEGDKKEACEVLYKLCNEKFSPGMVGALVTIYLGLNDEARAAKVFEDAVAWYHDHQECQGDLGSMWMQAAEFHMRHGHPAVAAKSLVELLKKNPTDKRTLARLIMAYIQFNKGTAQTYSKKLPSIDQLTKGLNPDDVETIPIYGSRTPRNRGEQSPGTPNSELIMRKKQRKRKGKLPKDYNLEIQPDPERWLPKYDRIGYRKKNSRRAKEIIKGSQGTTSSASEIFDFSKAVEKTPSEETTDSIDAKSISSNNSKRTAQNKKKRKTKW